MYSPTQQLLRNIGRIDFEQFKNDKYTQNEKNNAEKLPFYSKPVNENAKNSKIDLNELLIKNPHSTFLIKVTGNSMINAGITTGDLLVVDRSIKAKNNNIVVATINNELLVKRLKINDDKIELASENENFPNIKINEDDKFNVWGVVKNVIKYV